MALIVVADDHADLRELMTLVLEREGHTVVAVDNGVDALAAIRERRAELVITDLDLPPTDGVGLCHAVRRDPDLGDLPVIVVTTGTLPWDHRDEPAQACAYFIKPLRMAEVVAKTTEALQRGRHSHQKPCDSAAPA